MNPTSLPHLKNDSANLDLVRAVAVLCVFFAHFRDLITGTGAHISWLFGQMGVLIFFVHTSLVLMLSLERSAQRLQGAPLVADFYVRRFFRIYPLGVLCVTLAFVGLVPTSTESWGWPTYLSNLALTTNLTYSEDMWPVLWTLPLEVQMYVVLPLLFILLRHRSLGWALALWALAVAGGIIQPHISNRLSVAGYAPCFVSGVIAWRMMRAVRPRWRGTWWPIAFAATTGAFLIAPRYDEEYYRWAFCLLLGFAIPLFSDLRSATLRACARTVAKYSYGIYLAHYPILVFAFGFEGVIRWAVLTGLMVLVPVIAFRLLEQPMIDFGRRLAARRLIKDRASSLLPEAMAAAPGAHERPYAV